MSINTSSYIIYIDNDGIVNAENGITGSIDYAGTDASTIIQKAYTDLYNNSSSGTLFLKSGTYNINTTINLQLQVDIIGEGYGTTLVNRGTGPVFSFVRSGYNIYTVIEKLRFVGGGTGTGPAIQGRPVPPPPQSYTLTNYLKLRDITIDGMGSHGIYMPSRFELSSFENLRILNCAGDGIRLDYGAAAVHMKAINISGNAGNGFYIGWGVGNFLNIQQLSNNGQYGMYINDELKSIINVLHSESNGSGYGFYFVKGMGTHVNMLNMLDNYYINPAMHIAYTIGNKFHHE